MTNITYFHETIRDDESVSSSSDICYGSSHSASVQEENVVLLQPNIIEVGLEAKADASSLYVAIGRACFACTRPSDELEDDSSTIVSSTVQKEKEERRGDPLLREKIQFGRTIHTKPIKLRNFQKRVQGEGVSARRLSVAAETIGGWTPLQTGARKEGIDLNYDSGGKFSSTSAPLNSRSDCEILQSSNLKSFSFAELKAATRCFRYGSLLGEGVLGSVFRGWLDEHTLTASKHGKGIAIAVKRLNQEGIQGHEKWLAKVNYLGKLYHPNLVRIVGYCLEDEHRLLAYEFMPRGSLEDRLFKRTKSLPWILRMKVAVGAAKGLAFLHTGETMIIHGDFNTSNILLDSNYNAKLSDFGMAKAGQTFHTSHAYNRTVETINGDCADFDFDNGYAAPEYLVRGQMTPKSDVFSFGVVLLEILSGRRALDMNRPFTECSLLNWAKPYLEQKGGFVNILDKCLVGQYLPRHAQKAASLVRQCLSVEAKYRPNMDEVVSALEKLTEH